MAIIQGLIKRVENLERAVLEIREALASRSPAPSSKRTKAKESGEGDGLGT